MWSRWKTEVGNKCSQNKTFFTIKFRGCASAGGVAVRQRNTEWSKAEKQHKNRVRATGYSESLSSRDGRNGMRKALLFGLLKQGQRWFVEPRMPIQVLARGRLLGRCRSSLWGHEIDAKGRYLLTHVNLRAVSFLDQEMWSEESLRE